MNMNYDRISELMSKVSDFVSDLDWEEILKNAESGGTGKSRALRDVSDRTGVFKWVRAYKKDPNEYQCVRKVACETLAESNLVAKSMKSPFGGVVL